MTTSWKYRKYIWDNAISELKTRYAGSSFGVLWNILQPLFLILIFTFVFSKIMIAKLPGMDTTTSFAIYLCSGLLPWGIFSETIIRGSNAYIENSTYLKKLPVPEQIFVLQIVVSSGLVLALTFCLLFVIVLLLGGELSFKWVLLPIILTLLLTFCYGITLILSCLNVFFRDIGQFVNTAIQLWMWLTPIVYVKEILPATLQTLFSYNPLYWYIESLHDIIVYSNWPSTLSWILMIVFSLLAMILGTRILNKFRSEIRDVI